MFGSEHFCCCVVLNMFHSELNFNTEIYKMFHNQSQQLPTHFNTCNIQSLSVSLTGSDGFHKMAAMLTHQTNRCVST